MSSPPLSDSPDVAGNAERVLYGPGLSIQERLGPVTGALRLDRIVQVYHTKRRLDIPWFFKDEAGNEKQSIVVHPLNKRRHRGVDLFYMKSFLKKGVVKYVSGTPILVASGDEKPPYLAITWGSRSRAFYSAVNHCKKKDPSNAFINAALTTGLQDCVVLTWRTPKEVLQWLCDYHNAFHEGAGYPLVQLMTELLEIKPIPALRDPLLLMLTT